MNIENIEKEFYRNFAERGELGASLSVWEAGEPILLLSHGWCDKSQQHPWDTNTIVPIYSATKGPAVSVLLMLLDENGLTPESRVCQVWENFPNEQATFAELMSHQCGLAALDEQVSVFEYHAVIEAIENQSPNWDLGGAHGYHPRTFGFLLDESVRILAGRSLGEIWRERIAEPLDLDLWIGLPESEHHRVATLYPGKADKAELKSGFYKEFNELGSLVRKAFGSPKGLHGVHEMNTPKAWQAGLPAMGGVATAAALAKFYQACIGQVECFSDDVREWMQTSQVMGDDLILCTPTHFTCGFQKDPLDGDGQKMRHHYGPSKDAFGHPGAGGSHAYGDPENGISFAYTMNQMDLAVLPGAKSLDMIGSLY
ncbi:MAG: CubicO group peptidase (beta-lactamase class C family) [Cryomorphaceae bacterium]|jgi:CubicO group peptidase (beta-lactamase class C family)